MNIRNGVKGKEIYQKCVPFVEHHVLQVFSAFLKAFSKW
jgi:hypothetical protein